MEKSVADPQSLEHARAALSDGHPRLLPFLALLSSLIVVLATWRTPQSLFSDPSWQLKALQQHLTGQSPTINTLVQPDPHDISQDHFEWISWWPIGTNVLVYPVLRMGLTIGTAVRVLAALALVLGSVGFGYWVKIFRLPQWLAIALALGTPWIRYANLSLFQYAAEGLVFGICPWLLVGAFRLRSRWMEQRNEKLLWLLGYGVLLGFAYWLKYSAVFISLGALAHLTITVWRQGRRRRFFELSMVGGLFCLVAGVLNLLNHVMGAAMNAVTENPSFLLDWHLPFNFIGLMAMSMADADGLARYVLFHPGRSLLPFNYLTLCYLGLPGGLSLFWLLVRRHSSPALLLCRDVLLTLSALFVAVMTVFSARAMEARYIAAIGIALIPAAIESALQLAPKLRRATRALLLAGGIIYLAIPMAYGAFSVVGKIARTPVYRAGPSGLYNPLFATSDARAPLAELTATFNPQSDVWYLTEAFTAMDLPGRAILQHADFLPVDALKRTFRTSKPMRVHLLLPPWFEQNGKGAAIRGEFLGAGNWSSRTVPGMNYVEWTANLIAVSN
ncbi:MAG TPA: hypothetical protein VF123_17100 [Candidatus Sulfotelmatobacter sp.]